jgi:hypothetical protein
MQVETVGHLEEIAEQGRNNVKYVLAQFHCKMRYSSFRKDDALHSSWLAVVRQIALFSCFISVVGVSMTITSSPANAEVKINKVEYKGWKDAYRLSNGTVELVYVPSVARIMRYGYVGGPNVLWENQPLAGTVSHDRNPGTWRNVGGDKVWPWPQEDWGKLMPQAWPPPPAADSLPQEVIVTAKNSLQVTSQRVLPWGVRIMREIRMDPTGTAVHVTNRLERDVDGESTPVAPWTVTQVPAVTWVISRSLPVSTLPDGYKYYGEDAKFKSINKTAEGALVVERNGAKATKIGMDADIVGSLEGDTLFTVRFAVMVPADNAGLTYAAADRAQFYSQPDDDNAAKMGTLPYIEMEMTAPLKTLKKGETNTLSLVWELRKVPADKQNPAGVAALLKAM